VFTGIVEEIGEVVAVRETAEVVVLTVRGRTVTSDARHGDSIAVNGVCLTVVDPQGSTDGSWYPRRSSGRAWRQWPRARG